MSEETQPPDEIPEPEQEQSVARTKRRKWPFVLLGSVILIPAVVFALWSWIALSWTYSQGERAGYVQKFSRKGWICKTWEGELAMVNIPGAAQERWLFSVRNDSIAREILNNMGNRVALTYAEHRGIPTSCFGETAHFVNAVRRVSSP